MLLDIEKESQWCNLIRKVKLHAAMLPVIFLLFIMRLKQLDVSNTTICKCIFFSCAWRYLHILKEEDHRLQLVRHQKCIFVCVSLLFPTGKLTDKIFQEFQFSSVLIRSLIAIAYLEVLYVHNKTTRGHSSPIPVHPLHRGSYCVFPSIKGGKTQLG